MSETHLGDSSAAEWPMMMMKSDVDVWLWGMKW